MEGAFGSLYQRWGILQAPALFQSVSWSLCLQLQLARWLFKMVFSRSLPPVLRPPEADIPATCVGSP